MQDRPFVSAEKATTDRRQLGFMMGMGLPCIVAATLMMAAFCHGWTPSVTRAPPPNTSPKSLASSLKGSLLEEPDNTFGRMTYWDQSYKNDTDTNSTFSWYCGWEDELEPFFSELVPPERNPRVLIPGIGNDACIRDMFDSGYRRLSAFDYAPEGVECARIMFGPRRLQLMDDLRVADARFLPYDDSSFHAALDKGTLDSIYLSGGKDKALAKKHLAMAVSELARVVKKGGVVFSVTAACVGAVQQAFDEHSEANGSWKQLRDGSFCTTEDGYTSNNIDATMLVWERIK